MVRTRLTIVLLTGSLALAAPGVHAGSDPHAKKPAADAHAPKTTDAHAPKPKTDAHPPKADAHPPTAAAHPPAAAVQAARKTDAGKPTATDLHELSERIQEKLVGVLKAQQAKKPRPHDTPAHATANQRAEAVRSKERLEVVWKIDVVWPDQLQAGDDAALLNSERVAVSWEAPAAGATYVGSFGVAP